MTLLVVRSLVCRLGTRTVLEAVDLAFAGEVTAIVGPNGSGKTTLLRHLTGLDGASAGPLHPRPLKLIQCSDYGVLAVPARRH